VWLFGICGSGILVDDRERSGYCRAGGRGRRLDSKDHEKLAIQNVSQHAARGTLWTYLGSFASRLLAFAGSVLLARLLVPEQFGLMSYCLLAIQFIAIFNTFGMDAALIARRQHFDTAANTTFFFAIAISLLSYAVTWWMAPLLATFFDAPEVTALLRVLGLVLPIGSLDLVHHSIVQRQLRFRQTVLPEIGSTLIKAVVSVILAARGHGAWSLVIGHLVGTPPCPQWRYPSRRAARSVQRGAHRLRRRVV
jgi:O-antigen/teichoic acid export membrane protein